MKPYTKSHPWISFRLDLQDAPPRLWLFLGEAASKCDHIAGVPLKPAIAARMHQLFLAKGALATAAIEGNTLTEEQVIRHLEGQLQLPRSQEYLAREIDNIVNACNVIWTKVSAGTSSPLTPQEIKLFNRQVLEGLDVDSEVVPGEVRKHSVGVGRYRGAPAADCEFLLERLCDWLNGPDFDLPPGYDTAVAILKAIIAHLYLAWIHPFGDGNGRTARLVEFKLLVAAGVPTAAAHLLSNHYNQTRSRYYLELDRSSKAAGGPVAFLLYAAEGFVDQLQEQLKIIRDQQWQIAWNDYVYERFRDHQTPSTLRRRNLVLALSQSPRRTPIKEIATLTPPLAAAYARRTKKTLMRDLQALVTMGLITENDDGYRANKGVILAFLPGRNINRRTPTAEPRSPSNQTDPVS